MDKIAKFMADAATDCWNVEKAPSQTFLKLGYVMEKDKITLSFSRSENLRTCPRKFLIRDLKQYRAQQGAIYYAYGHAFAAGVQELFRSGSLERATIALMANWDYEYWEGDSPKDKFRSIYYCIVSLEHFYLYEFPELSHMYQLAWIDGKSGIELFVYLDVNEQYSFQMHIDLLLQNRETQALCVAEIKTSVLEQHEASWGNAEQTAGYYTVIEALSKKFNLPFEPSVIYITNQLTNVMSPENSYGFRTFIFDKDKTTSIDFLRTLLMEIETINMYRENNYFPKRGSNCVQFNRTCEFYGSCDLPVYQDQSTINDGVAYESLPMSAVDIYITTQEVFDLL